MAEWLGTHMAAISCSEDAGQICREIRTGTEAVLRVINPVNRMYCGPCTTVVAHNPQGEDIECGEDLYTDRENLEDIQCTKCKTFINPREQLLVHFKRKDLMTENELIQVMQRVGEPITESVIDRWLRTNRLTVRGYMHRGRFVAEAFSRRDARVFSLNQARQLRWQEREGAE
jgi:hypothetical protein